MPLHLSVRDILRGKLPGRRVPECLIRYLERIVHLEQMNFMDRPYHQLISWDPERRQIIGGYRYLFGSEAEIRDGQPFITSAHLYHYSERFIREYLPYSIELGRAFVQPEYQQREAGVKALFALDNLWDGIGAIMHNNPLIKHLFGKVTIYPTYSAEARELIYNYLERYHRDRDGLFEPYKPVPIQPLINDPFVGYDPVENYHILQHAVREVGTVIPPMFTAYLNLTGKLHFFGNSINDELADVYETGIMVDMRSVYRDKINRYISPYVEWLESGANTK